MSRAALLIGGAVVLGAVLAGCSPAGSAVPPEPAAQDGVRVEWAVEGSTLAVTTLGSGSCPALAQRAELVDGVVRIHVSTGDAEICSADMTPTTSEVAMPPGALMPVPVELGSDEHGFALVATLD